MYSTGKASQTCHEWIDRQISKLEVVTAAHPAEGMATQTAQPVQPAAHPAEAQAAHPAESPNPPAHPAEAHAAHPAEVPQMAHPAESTHAEVLAPADTGASEEPQSGG